MGQPFTWRSAQGVGVHLLVWLGAILCAVAVPFAIFALLSRGYRRPAEFAIDERRFIASSSGVFAGSQAIMCMFFAGGLVATERVPNRDAMRLAEFGWAWLVSAILLSVFVAAAVAFLVVRRPQLLLDSEGLTIRRLLGSTRLAWADLAPGGPLPPARRKQRHLQLFRKPPLGYPNYVPAAAIPIGWLEIDPAYIAAAIRLYVENPEERSTIGTAEGLARLKAGQSTMPQQGLSVGS